MWHDIHQLLHNTVHHFIKTKLNHCAIVTFSTAACTFFISALDHEYITNSLSQYLNFALKSCCMVLLIHICRTLIYTAVFHNNENLCCLN